MVSLPAMGVTYAVAVHRVLAPRVVIRTSVQYALARKTLMLAAMLPGALLVLALFRRSDESLATIIGGQPLGLRHPRRRVPARASLSRSRAWRGSTDDSSAPTTTPAPCSSRWPGAFRSRPIRTS